MIRPAEDAVAVLKEAMEDVWGALLNNDGVGTALARYYLKFPMMSAMFFRAAIRFQFTDNFDCRAVTRFLVAAYRAIPTDYRSLLAPREAEGVIRAEIGGESVLAEAISVTTLGLRDMLQVTTKKIFEGAVSRPQLLGDVVRTSNGPGIYLASVFVGHSLSASQYSDKNAMLQEALLESSAFVAVG
jgi:hypothetical protein